MHVYLKKVSMRLFKNLFYGFTATGGRNNTGMLVNYSKGGGHKRVYRVIDFQRYIWNTQGVVLTFEYDTNRSAPIMLLTYANGFLSYILGIVGLGIAAVVKTLSWIEAEESRLGYCSTYKFLKPGSYVHNLELRKLRGAQVVRTASNYSKFVSATKEGFAILKLRSKFLLKISSSCVATLGFLSSWTSTLFPKKNAGYSRHIGKRSHVRGVAKNPVDHPHGGGQGKTSGGRVSVTPWSYITKGLRTRRKLNYGSFILKR